MTSKSTLTSDPILIHTAGLVLAGGKSTRMQGHNKALYLLQGQNLLQHSIDNLRKNLPHSNPIAVSCGQHDYRAFCSLPQLTDDGALGPIAGIIAGLRWLQSQPALKFLAVIPCDAPFTPKQWITKLQRNLVNNCHAAYATTNGCAHFAHSLWSIDALDALEQAHNDHQYALKTTLRRLNGCAVDFSANSSTLDFFNINTQEQAFAATKHLG